MSIADAVIDRINELCTIRGITINKLCNISAVPQSTISEFMNGITKSIGIVNLKMLCDGFELSIAEFFNTDVFKNLEQEI